MLKSHCCVLERKLNLKFLLPFSGYLLTAPRIFRAGSTQEISVSLFSVSVPWIVNATLLPHADGVGGIIATDEAQFTSLADGTLKLEVWIIYMYMYLSTIIY